jgi:hypothetical protein
MPGLLPGGKLEEKIQGHRVIQPSAGCRMVVLGNYFSSALSIRNPEAA